MSREDLVRRIRAIGDRLIEEASPRDAEFFAMGFSECAEVLMGGANEECREFMMAYIEANAGNAALMRRGFAASAARLHEDTPPAANDVVH